MTHPEAGEPAPVRAGLGGEQPVERFEFDRPGRARRAAADASRATAVAQRRRQQRQIVLLVDLDRAEASQMRRS